MSKPSLLAWEQGVDNRFNTSVDQLFEDLVGETEQGDGTVAIWVLYRFLWLWDCNYKCSSPDFRNFELGKQEERKPRNQDFKAVPAWIISSGQIESGLGAFPGLTCWRAAANSLDEKSPERFTGDGIKALQRSDTS